MTDRDDIRRSAEREAREASCRRALARCTGTMTHLRRNTTRADPNTRILTKEERATEVTHPGQPCFNCGVKSAQHDEFGCRDWRVRP